MMLSKDCVTVCSGETKSKALRNRIYNRAVSSGVTCLLLYPTKNKYQS